VRPVISWKGYSSLGSSCGGRYSAALRIALPVGLSARYSISFTGVPVTMSRPYSSQWSGWAQNRPPA
jgi:hypothetical protein